MLVVLLFPQYLCGEWLKTHWPDDASNWMDVLWPQSRGHHSQLWVLVAAIAWLGTVMLIRQIIRGPGGRLLEKDTPRLASASTPGGITQYRSGRQVLGSLAIIAVAIACVPSELLFVTPAEQATHVDPMILRYLWGAAVATGWLLGARARKERARWRLMKVRAVLGTAKPTSYREQAAMLPPSLSREADARPVASLIGEFARSGLTATLRGRSADVLQRGKKVATLRTRVPASSKPEDFSIEVDLSADMRAIAEVFARTYGPIEYKGTNQAPEIVE